MSTTVSYAGLKFKHTDLIYQNDGDEANFRYSIYTRSIVSLDELREQWPEMPENLGDTLPLLETRLKTDGQEYAFSNEGFIIAKPFEKLPHVKRCNIYPLTEKRLQIDLEVMFTTKHCRAGDENGTYDVAAA